MDFLTTVWGYIDTLVHPSARADALLAARHRAFIAPRLLGSFAALATFPIYLVLCGAPDALEVALLGWLVAPISTCYFLSRTGRLQSAQIFSTFAIAALVMMAAWHTGGINSPAAIWLGLMPFEAALSASRRVIGIAIALALGCAIMLLAVTSASLIPQPLIDNPHGLPAVLGIIFAALFATSLGAGSLVRTSSGLLSAETDRFRLLADNMNDVITRHGRNGAVTYVSPAAEALLGVAPNELLGHRLFDRVHVADRPAYLTALSDAASGQDRSVEFRVRGGADGTRGNFVWVEMRYRPTDQAVKNGDVIAVMHDISERKFNERTLEIARAEAERANAGKTRFLATMSHELRTPLNAIIGFSDMLGNESLALDEERQREYARVINESGRHLLSVVNGILDMSKVEAGKFEIAAEPFAPALAISGCCDILALKAREAGVELKTRVEDNLPELVADRRAVNQILINLVSNAIKFTLRGGSVTVGASCDAADIVFAVDDTGVGVDEDDLPHLGEAFFQARGTYDRRHDGSGLGLSIVKGLVRLHDGTMDIRSRPGEGTRVTIRLPIGREKHSITNPIEFKQRSARMAGRSPQDSQVRKSA
ncbi:MAG TPA: PAS domain-containing sensor histidine kinase [Pseudolabrys sp.]|nr:PAS domain-containing sensor histidine kinase [Pseudolabrys sp.]